MIYATCLNEQSSGYSIMDECSIIMENLTIQLETTVMYITESSKFSDIITKLKNFIKSIIDKARTWYNNVFRKKYMERKKKYDELQKKDNANVDTKYNNYTKSDYKVDDEQQKQNNLNKYKAYIGTLEYKKIRCYDLYINASHGNNNLEHNIDYNKNPAYYDNREYMIDFDNLINERKKYIISQINECNLSNNTKITSIDDISKIKPEICEFSTYGNPIKDYEKITQKIKSLEDHINSTDNAFKSVINNLERGYNTYYIKQANELVKYFDDQQNFDMDQKYKDIASKLSVYIKAFISTATTMMNNDIQSVISYYNHINNLYDECINSLYTLQNRIISTANHFGLEYR